MDLAFAQEVEAMQLDLLAEWNHADDGGGAARGQHLKGLLRRGLGAEALDGVVYTTLHQLLDAFDGITVPGIDGIRGAQFGRTLQLHRNGVDGDDAPGPGNCRAVEGRHADTTAPDNRH